MLPLLRYGEGYAAQELIGRLVGSAFLAGLQGRESSKGLADEDLNDVLSPERQIRHASLSR
jgi:hypothetical protein